MSSALTYLECADFYLTNSKVTVSKGCGSRAPPIRQQEGQVHWKDGDVERILTMPVQWEYVDYSAQLHVGIDLEAVRIGRVDNPRATVAHIFGVPNTACPPGELPGSTNNATEHQPAMFLLYDDATSQLKLTTLKISARGLFLVCHLCCRYTAKH